MIETRHFGKTVLWRYPEDFRSLFSGFITRYTSSDAEPDVVLTVELSDEVPEGEFYTVKGHRALFRAVPDERSFIGVLSYWLRWLFAPVAEQSLVFHASAFASPAGAAVMTGPPGSGKSTLVKRLCADGKPFLGEDAVEMRLEDKVVEPSLPMSFLPAAVSRPVPLRALVALRYAPGFTPSIRRVEGRDAAQLLLPDIYNLKAVGEPGLGALAQLVDAGVYHLVYPGAEQALELLEQVVGD